MSETKPQAEAHLGSCSTGAVSITDLAPGELEKIQTAMHGNGWIRCREGRIELLPAHLPLLAPIEDPMLPWWRPFERNKGDTMQLELFGEEQLRPSWSPSIFISSLCGYGFTPENYKRQAELLERYGFVCLRSRRGDDSQYWELWYLPGLWSAKDRLKHAIEWKEEVERDNFGFPVFDDGITLSKVPEDKKLDAALEFLRRNCEFGSCDVSVQRMCQVIDD